MLKAAFKGIDKMRFGKEDTKSDRDVGSGSPVKIFESKKYNRNKDTKHGYGMQEVRQDRHIRIHRIIFPERVVDDGNEQPFILAFHRLEYIIVVVRPFLHISALSREISLISL